MNPNFKKEHQGQIKKWRKQMNDKQIKTTLSSGCINSVNIHALLYTLARASKRCCWWQTAARADAVLTRTIVSHLTLWALTQTILRASPELTVVWQGFEERLIIKEPGSKITHLDRVGSRSRARAVSITVAFSQMQLLWFRLSFPIGVDESALWIGK